jgi:hypothetical protein
MRSKAAKTQKKSKRADLIGGGGEESEKKKKSGKVGRSSVAREEERRLKVFEKKRLDEVSFGVVAMGKPWLVQPGIQSQARDRSAAPPALPVPMASFTI